MLEARSVFLPGWGDGDVVSLPLPVVWSSLRSGERCLSQDPKQVNLGVLLMRLALREFQFLLKFTTLWSQLGRGCWGVLQAISVFLWLGPWGWGAWKTFSPEEPFSLWVRRPWTSSRHITFLCLSPRQCQAVDSRGLWGISAPGSPVLLLRRCLYSLLCSGHLSMCAFPVSGNLSSAHPWPGGESIAGSLLWRRFDINDVAQLGLAWLLLFRAQPSYAHSFLFSFFSDRPVSHHVSQ